MQYCKAIILGLKISKFNFYKVGAFPDSKMIKDSPCNAEDTGSTPGQGPENPHTAGQLSL